MSAYRIGELLRALRQQRGLSQEQLAARAQVTVRSLRYWETSQRQPHAVELESVLKALESDSQERAQVAALLSDPRSVRLAQDAASAHDAPPALLGPLPGIGDLIQALRLRLDWTQERLAAEMAVNRATVIRWEATRTLPSEEDMERLCTILPSTLDERAALRNRRLLPSSWTPQLTLEECFEQYEALLHLRVQGTGSILALVDLHALALKRQLRFLLSRSSEALRLLAMVEIYHSWWLYMQGRMPEACEGSRRALNLLRGRFAPEEFWVTALNLLSAHAARGARGPENGTRLLYPWLDLIAASLHPLLLCDMAYYSGQALHHEEAAHFLQQAQRLVKGCRKENTVEDRHFRLTEARVLLSAGNPVEALAALPSLATSGDSRIHELLIWAETYLAAGDRNAAVRCLNDARTLLEDIPLPQRQAKLDQLTRQL